MSEIRPLRVVLAGQKEFARQVLALLIQRPAVLPVAVVARNGDRLQAYATERGVPVVESFADLRASYDLIIAAHSHDFITREVREAATLGAIGYHPSLLPRHRGRDAVRWTIKMQDPIAGGTVYWLNDTVDGGDIARQDWCHVQRDDTAESLWRRDLAPMGVRLLAQVLSDLQTGRVVRVAQDERVATWEPSWERPPLASSWRAELSRAQDEAERFAGFTVVRDPNVARNGFEYSADATECGGRVR